MNTVDEALLDAGAVLPTGGGAGTDTVDTLTTRAYRHPVLGDRTVVRLVPGTLGQAEDLTMEFLGFTAPEAVAEVGVVRQQALGFPAWALVHDPANGHHALALVKEIERLVRVAKSRIGPARDGFNELGERLARSVPHFLPTFYEEAARAFLAADSTSYAATMFGKAREAERLYALAIDEDRQHTVFLEFALAGALTAKALAAHARDLAARCDPATAYDRFRRLCVERTLGGMPPYAQMHADLRRLAKAAKLGAAEEETLLLELLAAPSILRAPAGFWTAYRPTLVRIARRDPEIRGRLLGMFPKECPADVWLDLLDEAGVTEALTGPAGGVPAAAESPDGPAGWLARLDRHRATWRRKRLPALLVLAERMAGRLRSDGVPVELCRSRQLVDLDLVDTCLALGVPLAEVPADTTCAVDRWLEDETEGRRDLVEVGRHPGLLPGLADSVEGHLRVNWSDHVSATPSRVAAVVGVPGLRAVLHWWMDRLADRVVQQGLTTINAELDRLALVSCPEGLAVNPEAVRRILDHDLGPVLGRTLRTGVFDEFGWPALEEAVTRIALDGQTGVHMLTQWPQLVVRAGDQVVVAGGDGVELEHLLRIPPDQRRWDWRTAVRYVDGQLLVSWDLGPERAGYWSGAPDDVFITPDDAFPTNAALSVALPGGGRTAGGRPLHAGDHSAQERGTVATDGLHHWVLVQSETDYSWHWREFDVATGALGRESLPAFFERGAVDGEPLDPHSCRLLPAGERLSGSPLGYRDGLVGWRVRRTPGGAQIGESVDGRTFTLPDVDDGHRARSGRLVGAIRFPGSGTLHGVVVQDAWRASGVGLWTADGMQFGFLGTGRQTSAFAEGTPLVPPPAYWHYLLPRDEAGSAALRVFTDRAAGELLAAVLAETAAVPDGDGVRKLVTEALPGVTHPALIDGVTGIVRDTARSTSRLLRLAGATAEISALPVSEQTDPDADKPGDRLLDAALRGLIPNCYDHGHEAVRLYLHVGAALTGREPGQPIAALVAGADPDWFDAIGALPAILHRSVSLVTPPEHRAALLDLLEIMAGSGLLAAGGRVRRVRLHSDTNQPVLEVGEILDLGGRRLVALRVDRSDGEVRALEHSADGRFGPVPGHTIGQESIQHTHGIDAERVTAFVALARERGALPWRPDVVRAISAAAGISLAEATVLLAGPADEHTWKHGRPDGWQIDPSVTDAAVEAAMESVQRDRTLSQGSGVHAVLLPDDLATLWSDGPALQRLAAWRAERVGARTPVDDELIVEFRRSGAATGLSPSEFLHGVANVATCRWLAGPVAGVDEDDLFVTLARAVPWLVRRLPNDHPVRAALPRVLELARQRLREPELGITIGGTDGERLEKFLRGLGVPVTRDERMIDAGLFYVPQRGYWHEIRFRPARLDGLDDPILAALIAFADGPTGPVVAVRAILGDQLDDWVGAEVPPGAEGAEHDPSRSAPALVAEVAERHGLGADAATLYLQLLALPDPTDRNVAGWTGWKPARLKAARAELAGTDLVVEAKRPRAGRSLFLPGGWLALGTPHLPLERWKLPLVIGGDDVVSALGVIVPVAPAPKLFELAWARVTTGDHPRFEELITKGRR
ncbi:hypothetical protein Dfulv_12775 [Dactylosporangium fulvum]|uniref:DNA-binding protein n=1 Tax=Dactylosporangium fulvum TaxID=53359 RepID=A0ABY5W4X7_9ACTN|nr:hypothetical protein [Dactylosporangium fulvum]UWP85045.1 hypothetical protein Dfulv_12775 [Dactylosporangium fulvum]